MPITYDHDHEREITLFAETNFRNQHRRFGIKTDDRRRHMYVLGKTGMGKTTLMENLILSDIIAGHGCCYIDPHGDTAEKLIDFIPPHRINDVVYFNPSDTAFPMGFNILETDNDDQKPLVASGLMGVFKKIWPDVWSARMEYILMNCVLALLDYPGATLLGISRLLVDKEYRARVTAKIRDPIVKTFWVAEFSSWSEKYATEAIAPVQNKVGQFLSSSVVRNIVAQVKSTINFRQIMDEGKICIVNLSKGRIGEDNMRLLGGMVVTKIQLAAQERQNIPEHDRRDFYVYVDEFQNFANESFATILSEARKYRLNLTIAHQYIEQLDEKVAPAIIGNVGTIILMRIGGTDAQFFETEFSPTFLPEDLVSLAKYQIYLKLMVDGVATPPFSANTMSPIAKRMASVEKVVQVSRERYAEPRALIEEKVLKWSGFEVVGPSGAPHAADDDYGVPVQASAPSSLESAVFTPPSTPSAAPVFGAAPASAPVVQAQVQAISSSQQTPGNIYYPPIETEEEQEARAERMQDRSLDLVARQPSAPAQQSSSEPLDLNTADTGSQEEYLSLKPERLAAIAAATAAANAGSGGGGKKKERPRFVHTCNRCGKTWELAIQLDTSRPMYCPECRPIVLEEKKNRGSVVKQIARTPPPPEQPMVHHEEASEMSFAHGGQIVAPSVAQKPRVTGAPAPQAAPEERGSIKIVVDQHTPTERLSLLEEIAQAKGQTLELDKKVLEARAGEPRREEARPSQQDTRPSHRDDRGSAPAASTPNAPSSRDARPPRRDDRGRRDAAPAAPRGDRGTSSQDARPPRRDDRGSAPSTTNASPSRDTRPPRKDDRPPREERSGRDVETRQVMHEEGLGSRPIPPSPDGSSSPPQNSATAKVLEKLLDRRSEHPAPAPAPSAPQPSLPRSKPPSALKQMVQREPPPFSDDASDFGDLDFGLKGVDSKPDSSSAPPVSGQPPSRPLQPGQRVQF